MRKVNVLVVLAILSYGGVALAVVNRPCPTGQIWDMNRGACVQKKKVKHKSPEEKYYDALDNLDGRAAKPDPKKAVALLTQACDAKLGMACTQLAFVHLRGRVGITPDPKQAITLYQKACTLGDLEGCVGAADMYASGVLGEIDHAKAVPVLDTACTGGSGRGCYLLAQKYDFALGVQASADKATSLYTKAFGLLSAECTNHAGASCDLVGLMYQNGTGVTADDAQASSFYKEGCDATSADACYHLGLMEESGIGMTAAPQDAFTLLQSTCTKYDHADSCFEAGAMLALDQVQGDVAILKPFAERACTLSQTRCDLLGYIDGVGKGVTQDLPASYRWYDVACGQGNGIACRVVGDKLQNGEGTSVDLANAITYWEKACQLQEGFGCASAGKQHFWGNDDAGIAKDPARAFLLFQQGCLRNDHESCQWAGELLTDGSDGSGNPQPQQAINYFVTACNLGRGQSCAWAGDLYSDGRATGTPDPFTAVGYYEQSCWATIETQTYGCIKAADSLRNGSDGITKDLVTAAQMATIDCRIEGGDECITADQILAEGQADQTAKDSLLDAMFTACGADPKIESACVAYALLERDGGYAVAKDEKDAVAKLGESCDRDYLHACWIEGSAYELGTGVVPSSDSAKALYTKACDGGYTQGCYALGNLLQSTGDTKDALALFSRSCDDGHASACNVLGFAYYTAKGVKWDVGKATELYQKGCDLGDAVACSNVAETYDYGITHDKDAKQAYTLYQKSCDMGFAGACGRAAWFIEHGTGGAKKDLDAAAKDYAAGCDNDMPDACVRLADLDKLTKKGSQSQIAQLYQRGFDSAKEQAESNPYYQWVLGTFHRDGIATVKDPKAAADLFVKACEGYDPNGCLDGGRMYLGDKGLPRNDELAAVQLDKACAANVSEACKLADQVRSQPGPGPLPKKQGCGCESGGGGEGGGVMVVMVVMIGMRRRRIAT